MAGRQPGPMTIAGLLLSAVRRLPVVCDFQDTTLSLGRRIKYQQRFSQRQPSKSHLMIARNAVAHTLARAGYDSMRDLVAFDGHKAFG